MQLTNKIFLFLLLFSSCKQENSNEKAIVSTTNLSEEIQKKELRLDKNKGVVLHNDTLFSGTSILNYGNEQIAESIQYFNGRKHLETKKWFFDGQLSYYSNYINGKLDGVSKTWWKNGELRSESKYKNGKVHGIQKQWYSSGAIFKEMNIENGKEVGIQKAWRENGKIYNNYEAKNGRIFGLKRSKLCFKLEEEDVKKDK